MSQEVAIHIIEGSENRTQKITNSELLNLVRMLFCKSIPAPELTKLSIKYRFRALNTPGMNNRCIFYKHS